MLTDLFIQNFTLIEKLQLEFDVGMTVLTGETGAGKSILLDALMLVMGERAHIDQIRDGQDELEVVAQFYRCDNNPLIVRKVVARHGRHKQFINGVPVTVTQLREAVAPLIDLTGQHAQQGLLQSKGQLAFLDAFAAHEELLTQMSESYAHYSEIQHKCSSLMTDERTRLTRIDWLQFQVDEIERVAPKTGELDELKKEREQLLNAGRLGEDAKQALEFLTESQNEMDALSRVQQAAAVLQRGAKYHDMLSQMSQSLLDAASLIDDVAREMARYLGKLEADPNRLAQVEDRLFELQRLIRKHGSSIDDVFVVHGAMSLELSQLQCVAESIEVYGIELSAAKNRCQEIASQLSLSRKNAGQRFVSLVKEELKDLGMPQVHFEVELLPQELTSLGVDQIRLLFSANPGVTPHSLEKIASGGELSRVMLGIKRVLLTKDLTLVSIFDEVDAGVGGAMGEAIGEKLQVIAQGRQVLCITHLAQVAARANAHMKVEKCVVNGQTVTTVRTLDREGRIEELARMMGGRQMTDITRRHAKEFLEQAQA